MFKKSRRKIVAAIMSVLALLWAGTLGIIYASSYFEMQKQNEQMLQTHAQMYVLPGELDQMMPPSGPRPDSDPGMKPGFDPESPKFRLSTFYTVAISYDGEILEIKNEPPTLHANDDLARLALQIVKNGEMTGREDDLAFLKADKSGYILVTFMGK